MYLKELYLYPNQIVVVASTLNEREFSSFIVSLNFVGSSD